MTETMDLDSKESKFLNRKVFNIPQGACREFKKGRRAYFVKDGQWYELVPYENNGNSKLQRKIQKLQDKIRQLKLKKEQV